MPVACPVPHLQRRGPHRLRLLHTYLQSRAALLQPAAGQATPPRSAARLSSAVHAVASVHAPMPTCIMASAGASLLVLILPLLDQHLHAYSHNCHMASSCPAPNNLMCGCRTYPNPDPQCTQGLQLQLRTARASDVKVQFRKSVRTQTKQTEREVQVQVRQFAEPEPEVQFGVQSAFGIWKVREFGSPADVIGGPMISANLMPAGSA
ncbi:hypothetical protein C8R44DRAFT_747055 [Mycena epipterygia]|nr:hypothetical protein C8R44DRAFT_747055 [Mycena epipterygia]